MKCAALSDRQMKQLSCLHSETSVGWIWFHLLYVICANRSSLLQDGWGTHLTVILRNALTVCHHLGGETSHGSAWHVPWTGIRGVSSGEVAGVRDEMGEPLALEAAWAAGAKQMYSDTGRERKFAIPYTARFTIYARAWLYCVHSHYDQLVFALYVHNCNYYHVSRL